MNLLILSLMAKLGIWSADAEIGLTLN